MRSECKEKYMCGIAGFYNAEGNYQQQKEKWTSVLVSMHECLAHRGNDESGIYLSDMAGLSHARLSIRDIVTGKQPIIRQKNERNTRLYTMANYITPRNSPVTCGSPAMNFRRLRTPKSFFMPICSTAPVLSGN